ncbi:pyruvate ferredoxin oxidoreductase gamma subunit [Kribbella orskensis]|uniref:Pyruvate ferredoxin oxidoreductase gamma subunit n=1 Tax=Kribbella orskensis TaxID=2512216 RepID=A0ABY2B935_9ACTN|nr:MULTISPECIES: 2-oxoacid:acceptor oxidoreductase family protein [Kribbella]TCN31166.1 pyruvate ferredoxin oxidoreductase gamma subunit [Kribbella sp. VKM Ac-2500]TCO11672.1 pyruvate ferredoxin oxidoreductase gamma subunit [Kribbella orskensis]
MFQVRIHGRGGQGVVTTAELLSVAAFAEGRHAQAFPTFGSERTGAPVVGFCRIDDQPIRTHEPVDRPDAVIIQDATLVHQVDLFEGLATDGYLLVNTSYGLAELGLDAFVRRFDPDRVMTIPATELALMHLGRPLPGAVLLAAFAALTGQVHLSSVLEAIKERFAEPVATNNVAAAEDAYDRVRAQIKETARAQAD